VSRPEDADALTTGWWGHVPMTGIARDHVAGA
jgi:hypothetical protein